MEKFSRFMCITHTNTSFFCDFSCLWVKFTPPSLSLSIPLSVSLYNGFVEKLYYCMLYQHYHYYDIILIVTVIIIEFESLFTGLRFYNFLHYDTEKLMSMFESMFTAVFLPSNQPHIAMMGDFQINKCFVYVTGILQMYSWFNILFVNINFLLNYWFPMDRFIVAWFIGNCLINVNHIFYLLYNIFLKWVWNFQFYFSWWMLIRLFYLISMNKRFKFLNYLQNAVKPADKGDSGGNRNPLNPDETHDKFWNDDW